MFTETREEVRSHFLNVWQKMTAKEPLEPLEQLLAQVIEAHPEYHSLFDNPERLMHEDFNGDANEVNPFLHMSLHIALVEQLQTNRPSGITDAYQKLLTSGKFDAHALEHRMMDCLSASLWQAQRDSRPPDERQYLNCLQQIQ